MYSLVAAAVPSLIVILHTGSIAILTSFQTGQIYPPSERNFVKVIYVQILILSVFFFLQSQINHNRMEPYALTRPVRFPLKNVSSPF